MRGVLLVGVVVVLAACTSATGGHGSTAPNVSSATADAPSASVPGSGSSGPSASSDSTSLTLPPTASPSGSPSGAPLSCPPGSVTATGAPFCYPLPTGFTDFSTRTDYGTGWTYRTLVGVGGPDLIEVLGSLGSQDFDRLSDTQLRAYFDRAGLIEKGKLGFTSVSPVATTTIDGVRAFQQQGTYSNGVESTLVRAFAGRSIVFVSCQSRIQNTRVALACGQVISQLKIART